MGAQLVQSKTFSYKLAVDESVDILVKENSEFSEVALQVIAYGDPVSYEVSELFGLKVGAAVPTTDATKNFAHSAAGSNMPANANPKVAGQIALKVGWRITNKAAAARQFRGAVSWAIGYGGAG